jgi:NAD-dependent deacetylase
MGDVKKKITVFSGAGLDRESGILTFRDCKDGLWNNHKIDEVATPEGWKKDPSRVLNFYNERRRELPNVQPNTAHIDLTLLEDDYDVTHVTQNVSDLLERAGATNVLHLHGELTKARGAIGTGNARSYLSNTANSIDIGYNDINIGDMCPETNSQLRPDIVWFGEYPFQIDRAYQAFRNADIVLIIGTSLEISYTLDFFKEVKKDCQVIYIDPNPALILRLEYDLNIEHVVKPATKGVDEVVNRLLKQAVDEEK